MKYDIYGIGAALVDTEIEVEDADLKQFGVEKGVMTLVDESRQQELIDLLSDHLVASKRASGGSGANSIIAASGFGAKTFYSCRVANDENGDFYLKDLAEAKVEYHDHNGSGEGTTGKCLVMITPDAERTMNSFLGISQTVSEAELDEDAIAASRYVYLEGYLVSSDSGRAAAVRLRELAEQYGVRTSLTFSDPAMVQLFRDGLVEMLGTGVDLLFCNEAEALGFTGTDSPEAALEALKPICNGLAMTLGARGALLWDGETTHHVEAEPVKPIDTNGAGDMFAGAFLYALTQGHDFPTAGRLASAACARLIREFGPRLPAEAHLEIRRRVLGQ